MAIKASSDTDLMFQFYLPYYLGENTNLLDTN